MANAIHLALLLGLFLPRWANAQQPIVPVPLTPFGDGQDSVLTANLEYRVLQTTFVVVVPAGFVTDFASTPRALWSVVPPTGRYQLAAVVHDFLYWDQGCAREQADAQMRRWRRREVAAAFAQWGPVMHADLFNATHCDWTRYAKRV